MMFAVDCLAARRVVDSQVQYLIRWEGFGRRADTWETRESAGIEPPGGRRGRDRRRVCGRGPRHRIGRVTAAAAPLSLPPGPVAVGAALRLDLLVRHVRVRVSLLAADSAEASQRPGDPFGLEHDGLVAAAASCVAGVIIAEPARLEQVVARWPRVRCKRLHLVFARRLDHLAFPLTHISSNF